MRTILSRLRVEEYVSLGASIIFFAVFWLGFRAYFTMDTFVKTLGYYLVLGGVFFIPLTLFIFFYLLLKWYMILGNSAMKMINKGFGEFRKFKSVWREGGEITFELLRTLFFIFLPITLLIMILANASDALKSYLVDDMLMEVDNVLTGGYPFIWLHTAIPLSVRTVLTPLVLFAFRYAVPFVIGGSVLFLFLLPSRRMFSLFWISNFIAFVVALFLWLWFPAHSPNNMYVANVYKRDFPQEISEELSRYQPDSATSAFLVLWQEAQRENPPISTIPSFHVIWGALVVYVLGRVRKFTLWASLPWFALSSFGTVYLAQHYFIDVIAGLLVAAISVVLSGLALGWSRSRGRTVGPQEIIHQDSRRAFAWIHERARTIF